MTEAPTLARDRARARFVSTTVVGIGLLLDLFAALTGRPDLDLMGIVLTVMCGVFPFGLPLACLVMVNGIRRGGAARKPADSYTMVAQVVLPLFSGVPAGVVALALGYQWAGVSAAVGSAIVAALLWPSENRLDRIADGSARVYFPIVAA